MFHEILKYNDKAERLDSVKRELHRIEFNRSTVSLRSGYDVQGGHLETKVMNYEAKLLQKNQA